MAYPFKSVVLLEVSCGQVVERTGSDHLLFGCWYIFIHAVTGAWGSQKCIFQILYIKLKWHCNTQHISLVKCVTSPNKSHNDKEKVFMMVLLWSTMDFCSKCSYNHMKLEIVSLFTLLQRYKENHLAGIITLINSSYFDFILGLLKPHQQTDML